MADIVNLKKLVTIGAKLGNLAGSAYEDGKLDQKDLALIPEAVMILPLFIDIKFAEVLPEGKDLDEGEISALLAHFNTEFDLPQDALEDNIEKVLSIANLMRSMVMQLISIFKKPAV